MLSIPIAKVKNASAGVGFQPLPVEISCEISFLIATPNPPVRTPSDNKAAPSHRIQADDLPWVPRGGRERTNNHNPTKARGSTGRSSVQPVRRGFTWAIARSIA